MWRWSAARLLMLLGVVCTNPSANSVGSAVPGLAARTSVGTCGFGCDTVQQSSGQKVPLILMELELDEIPRLRGGGKNKKMGRRVRQLHNFVPKQNRVGQNPLQKNKPHRKRKKAKDREAAKKKSLNVLTSIKQADREALYNKGLIDTPRVSEDARMGTLGKNFVDMETWVERRDNLQLQVHGPGQQEEGAREQEEEEYVSVEPFECSDDSLDALVKAGMPVQNKENLSSVDPDQVCEGVSEENSGEEKYQNSDEVEGSSELDEVSWMTDVGNNSAVQMMDEGATFSAVHEVEAGPEARGSVPVMMDDSDGVAVLPERQATREYDVLLEGDIIKYVQSNNSLIDATIADVDRGIDPPSYTVAIGTSYRQTIRERIRFVARPLTAPHTPKNATQPSAKPVFGEVGSLDPTEPFIDKQRRWVHPALRGDGDNDIFSEESYNPYEDLMKEEGKDGDAQQRKEMIDKAAEGDPRFNLGALEEIEKASTALSGGQDKSKEVDPMEALLRYTRKTWEDERAKKKMYEKQFRERCGGGTSLGAWQREKHTAVRDDHRFRRYGR